MSSERLLNVSNLSVTLSEAKILDDVSWSLSRGELAAITGPNGAGKTTMLKAVLGLLPYEGRIELMGHAVDGLERKERAQRVAWVPQQSRIDVPLVVRDVVMQGRFAHRGLLSGPNREDVGAVDRAIEQVDVGHLEERNFLSLSGGEQRRVLIARALATEAPVLLLDEPTAGLDLPHVLDLFHTLQELQSTGRAIVIVIHEIGWAIRFAQKVLLLCCGQAIADGPPGEVFTDENLREIYGVRKSDIPGISFERVREDDED
jgi:iron complex transport system ATP-binding protein